MIDIATTRFDRLLSALMGDEYQDNVLYSNGFRAFYECRPYCDMRTELERNGWIAARKHEQAMALRIVTRGG